VVSPQGETFCWVVGLRSLKESLTGSNIESDIGERKWWAAVERCRHGRSVGLWMGLLLSALFDRSAQVKIYEIGH
jgi:hypothetical protein